MKRAIRKHLSDFLAIIGLMVVAAVVGGYILNEQRLRFPIIEDAPFRLNAELPDAQAVTPGQGQSVDVAGVRIGEVGSVELKGGRAIVALDIEQRYRDLIRTDAGALLRPRTGLKDMFLDVDPGSQDAPIAKEGFTIPIERTRTDVDLDEILLALDRDTRDYVQLLANGAGRGLEGRGRDLAEVFRRFEPTFRDLGRVNRAVAQERSALKRLIGSLARLNERLADKDDALARLVSASATTFRAFASEDRNLSGAVRELGPTLEQATRTLRTVRAFATELGPAADRLVPTFRALERANREVTPFAREAAPIIRSDIRPFVRAARPLTRDLRPAAEQLGRATPDTTRAIRVLNRFFNMLAFNPEGREGPDDDDRQEGYLFWFAWVTHQTVNLINVDDANGPLRPIFLTGTCSTLETLVEESPQIEFALNLSGILATFCSNPETASLDVERARRRADRAEASAQGRDR